MTKKSFNFYNGHIILSGLNDKPQATRNAIFVIIQHVELTKPLKTSCL